ncbi:alpha/beta fold hydrolase [Nonomuraea sp. NPDC046802]|uniref:alpha/beta fold hydrolase n=1 Tax=Nonomuraea sp. NPDC046802 TaxID=3154919 RepID=UPI0033C0B7D1
MPGRTGKLVAGVTMAAALAGPAASAVAGTPAVRAVAGTPAAPAVAGTPAVRGAATVQTPAAGAAATTGLAWRPCAGRDVPAGMQCAAIEVPVDWARPGGRTVKLDLVRLPATEPAGRIGSVLGAPGGPGRNGIDDLKLAAGDLGELRRRFDLVAYKPRPTVWSEQMPASCGKPATALEEPRDRAAYRKLAATMAKAFEACRADDTSGLFGHLDGLSVARDMDAVRKALGEERLNVMASSYGGVSAAAYARLFPQRIRAMYLDGVVNQTEGWPTATLVGLRGVDAAFTRFTRWCATTPACKLHGQDSGAIWREVVEGADREPIPVTSAEFGKGELTGWHLRSFGFVGDPGDGHARWLSFAESLDKARRGDGSGFAEFVLGNARVWSMPGMLAMTCGDERGYASYAQLRDHRRQAKKVSPIFGGAAFDSLGCTGWPLKVANPARKLPVRGLPPMLGAGTLENDFAITERFTRMVPGSVALGYDGPGHVLYVSGKKCPIAHATAYLTDLKLPKPGTVCPAEP